MSFLVLPYLELHSFNTCFILPPFYPQIFNIFLFPEGGNKKEKKEKKKRKPCHSLYLLGIFVADENDDWVDVDAVETFNGVRSDVK